MYDWLYLLGEHAWIPSGFLVAFEKPYRRSFTCVWSASTSIMPSRPGCFGWVLSVFGLHLYVWSVYPSIMHGHRRVSPTFALCMCQQPAPRYSASERALRREGGVATSGSGPSLASVKLDFRDRGDATLVPHASSTMSSAMQSPVAFHPTVRQLHSWRSPCRRRVWGMSQQQLHLNVNVL